MVAFYRVPSVKFGGVAIDVGLCPLRSIFSVGEVAVREHQGIIGIVKARFNLDVEFAGEIDRSRVSGKLIPIVNDM
jgi:hypothetical protein